MNTQLDVPVVANPQAFMAEYPCSCADIVWAHQGAIQRGEFTLQQALAGRRFAMP